MNLRFPRVHSVFGTANICLFWNAMIVFIHPEVVGIVGHTIGFSHFGDLDFQFSWPLRYTWRFFVANLFSQQSVVKIFLTSAGYPIIRPGTRDTADRTACSKGPAHEGATCQSTPVFQETRQGSTIPKSGIITVWKREENKYSQQVSCSHLELEWEV